MPRRRIENLDENILKAILSIGANEGVKQVTADKVAKKLSISDGTVYGHYKTKRDFLDAAAQYFDRKQMENVVQMAYDNKSASEIWDVMIESFIADPEGSMYYNNYTLTFGFDVTANNPRSNEFLEVAKIFFKTDKQVSDEVYLILWDYITSMAFYYSEKFIHGYLPCTDEVKQTVKCLVFDGINNLI